ncbi:putative aspergillopepsin [Mytilinidion resinicola]|uniref:Aspergillopepsin n=1 Tax=Mytilinidion resinicola TaxID=574789 RepID=A0A6A6Z2I5_9PEZI|nr:putative aspergillopepsin [Mytilinidion resinicola]KAF2815346.1 putative aspergillopepsin [Mytilinidion resinicola]
MKLSLFLATVLLASGSLSRPARNRRAARTFGSQPLIRVPGKTDATETNGTANVSYSSNWSGAVLESPPSGESFTSAVGTFTVPAVSAGTGSASSWSSSAWVGIDGDTYGNAILQAGVDFTIDSSGSVTYDSWYEWYPDYAYDFDNFDVSEGDVITISIASSSSSEGTVTLTDETTGQSVSQTLSAPSSDATLAGQNAEWIVEDFEQNGSLVPLSDFNTVTFTDASATTDSGDSVGLSGATVIDLKQDNSVLTSVTIESDSSVEITYV